MSPVKQKRSIQIQTCGQKVGSVGLNKVEMCELVFNHRMSTATNSHVVDRFVFINKRRLQS